MDVIIILIIIIIISIIIILLSLHAICNGQKKSTNFDESEAWKQADVRKLEENSAF